MFKCSQCNYFSDRKFNFSRHIRAKHKRIIIKVENTINEQNVCPNEQNVCPNEQNVCPNEQNVCPKCHKVYKTKKHLLNHESKCNGIDELTCSRCMISFTTRAAKHKHIKADKCKARSIIHARTPNIQKITNNIDNSVNKTVNNIQINNFGSERIDHISEDVINRILQSGINTIPLYIEKKHFDKNFPENKNIKYTDDNKCRVMENNMWKEKDISLLSTDLIKNNSEVLLMYCDNNEIKLLNEIKDADKYDHIRNKLFIIYDKSDNQKYNHVLTKIKDLIKNSNKDDFEE
jgi:hypothetical protein